MKHKLISCLLLVVIIVSMFAGCASEGGICAIPDFSVRFSSIEEYHAFVLASEMSDADIEQYINGNDESLLYVDEFHGGDAMLTVRDIVEAAPIPKLPGMRLSDMWLNFYSFGMENMVHEGVYYKFVGDTGQVVVVSVYDKESDISVHDEDGGERAISLKELRRRCKKIKTSNSAITDLWYSKRQTEGREIFYALTDDAVYRVTGYDTTKDALLEIINGMEFADFKDEFMEHDGREYINEALQRKGNIYEAFVRAGEDEIKPYQLNVQGEVWREGRMVSYEGPAPEDVFYDLIKEGKIPSIKYETNFSTGFYINKSEMSYVDIYCLDEGQGTVVPVASRGAALPQGTYYVAMYADVEGRYIEEADKYENEHVCYLFELVMANPHEISPDNILEK